jgi:alpha-D-xyloside xylohydrolase
MKAPVRLGSRLAHLALLSAALLASASACSSKSAATPPPAVDLASGEARVHVDSAAGTVELQRAGATLARFDLKGFQLGVLAAIDDKTNYDPLPLVTPTPLYPTPDDFTWLAVDHLEAAALAGSELTVPIVFERGLRATLRVTATRAGSFKATLVPADASAPIGYFRLRPRVDATEQYYGLGEYYDSVAHRGKVRPMHIVVDGSIESGYNEAHVPVPFVIGTRGWGMFVEDPHPGVFDVAATAPDAVDVMFGTGLASSKGLTFHLFAAARALDVTKAYYDVAGYPKLPGRSWLGPVIWRDENKNQAELENDLDLMRSLDLADSAIWIDRPYATGVQTFDFDPAKFTDPTAMIAKAHAMGYRAALWHVPYLDEKDASTLALRNEAIAKGYYPKENGLLLNKWGKPIDLTNPAAYAWWQQHVRAYTDAGIEGFKMDYGEDVVPGLGAARNVWRFADGSDERTMSSQFQLFYHRVYAETLPKEGGFLLCRHATYGDQKNVSVIWPGDLETDFSHHRDEVIAKDGSTYVTVGGLPASLIAGLSLGPSGFPFYGADTGGYRRGPPDKELLTRWFEQTSLSTVMQVGTSASTLPWDKAADYDDEMLGWYRTYARLHLRLFPYVWTYAQNLAVDGRAIARPLGLAYPELGAHPDDTYLLGDSLLVAPVVARGQRTRAVPMPPGEWIDWWKGTRFTGGPTASGVNVDAPLGTLPLFVAAGSIVPLLRPTIDTMSPTSMPDAIDSYATTPGVLWARVAPGPASTFTLFDGAVLSQEKTAAAITLSSKDGGEFKYGVVFDVVAVAAKPKSVTDGGAALAEVADPAALDKATSGWTYTSEVGGTVLVKVPAGTHAVSIGTP